MDELHHDLAYKRAKKLKISMKKYIQNLITDDIELAKIYEPELVE